MFNITSLDVFKLLTLYALATSNIFIISLLGWVICANLPSLRLAVRSHLLDVKQSLWLVINTLLKLSPIYEMQRACHGTRYKTNVCYIGEDQRTLASLAIEYRASGGFSQHLDVKSRRAVLVSLDSYLQFRILDHTHTHHTQYTTICLNEHWLYCQQ